MWIYDVKAILRGRAWSKADLIFLCDMEAAGLTPQQAASYFDVRRDPIEDSGYVAAHCDLCSIDLLYSPGERAEWERRAIESRQAQELFLLQFIS